MVTGGGHVLMLALQQKPLSSWLTSSIPFVGELKGSK